MLCVLKRTVSLRWFFWAPTAYLFVVENKTFFFFRSLNKRLSRLRGCAGWSAPWLLECQQKYGFLTSCETFSQSFANRKDTAPSKLSPPLDPRMSLNSTEWASAGRKYPNRIVYAANKPQINPGLGQTKTSAKSDLRLRFQDEGATCPFSASEDSDLTGLIHRLLSVLSATQFALLMLSYLIAGFNP